MNKSIFSQSTLEVMDNNTTKIKLIFVPYLIISLATLIGWTFLHWLLFIKLKVYPVDERILNIIVPGIISYVTWLVWLRKPIELLKPKSSNSIISMIYDFVPFVPICSIISFTLFAQQYIEEVSGNLTALTNIAEINKTEKSHYYTVKNIYIDKKHFSVKKYSKPSSSKSNIISSDLKMVMSFAVPVYNSAEDTLKNDVEAWYCLSNKEYVNKSFHEKENQMQFEKFANKNLVDFHNLNLNKFEFLERIEPTNNGTYEHLLSLIKTNKKYKNNSDIILMPHTEVYENRGNTDLLNTVMFFGGGTMLFLIMILFAKMKESEEEKIPDGSDISAI